MEKFGIKDFQRSLRPMKGKDLEGMTAKHPFIDRDSKVVLAGYVSMEDAQDASHSPGHGQDDYQTGRKYNLPTIMPVDPKGKFDSTCGEFSGMKVYEANKPILEKLASLGALLKAEDITHSYPHCWRCKKPIIFRATDQYFMKIDHEGLRDKMISAISKDIKWVPAIGEHRIKAMVQNRPDWCLSRQRYWGVPIIAFYCKGCKEVLLDGEVISHVADIFEKEGADAWFSRKRPSFFPQGPHVKSAQAKIS